jgi:hypothetical protein
MNHAADIRKSMKNIVKILIYAFALLFGFSANAQNTVARDLCVVTFGDGKTFYAKVQSKGGNEVHTKMLHSDSMYSFEGTTVKSSGGAYKAGHKCRRIVYYGGRVKELSYVGNFIEVTFADGIPFFAQVESIGNDGFVTKMLHSGNQYKFNGDGTVLSSTGVYKVGHKTKSIMLLTRRK